MSSATGGTKSGVAGSTAFGGTTGAGGQGGTASAGGQGGTASGGGGGASSAGSMSTGGTATGGASMGGSAGTGATGCGGIKAWKGGDSTLTIARGEVIQWMGRRYKANEPIAYPNSECAPDAPAMWCMSWFTDDGSC